MTYIVAVLLLILFMLCRTISNTITYCYQHVAYQKALKDKGIVQSMSRKGNCFDNAIMENFFGIMKTELLYQKEFDSINQFKCELKKYIHYNNERIKLRLKGKPPVQYRTLATIF